MSVVGYEFTHKPALFNSTSLGRAAAANLANGTMQATKGPMASMRLTDAGETVSKHINPTQHWGSTYKNIVDETTSKGRVVSKRPTWSINRQAYTSSRGLYLTEFGDSYGKTGDNPRDILPAGALKQSHKNNELSIGTSQVTNHIPGYNGFIPHVDVNPKAIEQSIGTSVRNTIIKQNIVEN